MSCNEIISDQMDKMRQELITAEKKLAAVKVLMDDGAVFYKDPRRGKFGEIENACIFSPNDYARMIAIRERMYAALR